MQQSTLDFTQSCHSQPLAARMRPRHIDEYIGQTHLLSADKPLAQAIAARQCHSMILWGPPGTGKTTLAKLLAAQADAHFETLSAVFSGVKDLRSLIDAAKHRLQKTILFVDEIHRFNKAQQDAFLPFVEDGTITLIGATTENPAFELNNALLSRARVYVLKALTDNEILAIINQAIDDEQRGYGEWQVDFPIDLRQQLACLADGDARRALNLLEILIECASARGGQITLNETHLSQMASQQHRRFDNKGDVFYDQISALHKSVRGSAPDAALYWFARMIDAGCDPLYIARRVIRMASEDIGNADPRALSLAVDAAATFERLGSPEGELAIAQAITYLACCNKSNAVYLAYQAAMRDVQQHGSLEVPTHLRNAPTALAKSMGHGHEYRYAHDEPHAYAAGECYLPEKLVRRQYYQPVERGLEQQIKQRLDFLRQLDGAEDGDKKPNE